MQDLQFCAMHYFFSPLHGGRRGYRNCLGAIGASCEVYIVEPLCNGLAHETTMQWRNKSHIYLPSSI